MNHPSHLFKHLIIIFALALATAACDGPVGPPGPQGPAGEDGAQGPQGPQGEDGRDGNENVVVYGFSNVDMRDRENAVICIEDVSEQEMHLSVWLVFLVFNANGIDAYYDMPGYGRLGETYYRIGHQFSSSTCPDAVHWSITKESGPGEQYAGLRIFRISLQSIGNLMASPSETLIPANLDISDYHAAMDYYGLDEGDVVRL